MLDGRARIGYFDEQRHGLAAPIPATMSQPSVCSPWARLRRSGSTLPLPRVDGRSVRDVPSSVLSGAFEAALDRRVDVPAVLKIAEPAAEAPSARFGPS